MVGNMKVCQLNHFNVCFCTLVVNAVVAELSCSSDLCVPQTVQYHYETNTLILVWRQGNFTLGGYSFGMLPTQNGYNITAVLNGEGGLSSNISFIANANNRTTTDCIDYVVDPYQCSLVIGGLHFHIIISIKLC